jgi:hypothetical protein
MLLSLLAVLASAAGAVGGSQAPQPQSSAGLAVL